MQDLKYAMFLGALLVSQPSLPGATEEFETLAQWSRAYVSKIQFWDSRRGWLLSDGRIRKTSDGGRTWTSIDIGARVGALDIGVATAGHGWVDLVHATSPASVSRRFTSDYGNTWADGPPLPAGPTATLGTRGPAIAVQIDGQVLGYQREAGAWLKLSELPLGSIDWQPRFTSVLFSDSRNGLSAIDDLLFWTANSGKTWQKVTFEPHCSDPDFFRSFDKSPAAVAVLGSIGLLRFENGFLFYSGDHGKSWCSSKVPDSTEKKSGAQPVAPFAMVNEDLSFMISRDQRLLQTIDGGRQWKSLRTGGDEFFGAIFCTGGWCWAASDIRLFRWRVE